MKNPYSILKEHEGKYIRYAQLCDIIKEEPKRGNSKNAHINHLKEYVDLIETKGRIYIGRVYDADDELKIIDNRDKFKTYIRQFLVNLFYQIRRVNDDDCVVMTNRDILEMTCMVNNNYFIGKNAPYKYLDVFDVNMNKDDVPNEYYLMNKIIDETNIFFSSSYRLLKRVVYNTLKQLENSSLIVANKTFRLYKNTIDENGVLRSVQHNCTDEEIKEIISVQYNAIMEFNEESNELYGMDSKHQLHDIQHVHYLSKEDKKRFYKILNTMLKERFKDEGWNAYSVAWKIHFADLESLGYEIRKINYDQLNQNVQDKLMSAKDLNLIESSLKQQFIDTFIKRP